MPDVSATLGSPVASNSAAMITAIAARAVNATRGRGRLFSRFGGAGMIPRSVRPGGGERPRIRGHASEVLRGGDAFGLGLFEVGGQVCRHLLGERIGDAKSPPLLATLLNEFTHEATSTLTEASTA